MARLLVREVLKRTEHQEVHESPAHPIPSLRQCLPLGSPAFLQGQFRAILSAAVSQHAALLLKRTEPVTAVELWLTREEPSPWGEVLRFRVTCWFGDFSISLYR